MFGGLIAIELGVHDCLNCGITRTRFRTSLGQISTTSGLMRRSLNTRDNSNDAGQCLNFGLRITNAGGKCDPPNDCPADD